MSRFMVTAVGRDQPGVVAALAGVLVELGCNLSDTQMAVLQGYASMMLVADAPASLDAVVMQEALAAGTAHLDQAVWVQPLGDAEAPAAPGRRWLVSVHGADRPGVVFEVTRLLAEAGINVVGLHSRQAGPVASLAMEVDVPHSLDGEEVAVSMDRLGEDLGMACSMRPAPEHH